jgi:hypothetical protein
MYLKVPGDSDVLGCRDALTVANLARTSVNRRCVGTEASSLLLATIIALITSDVLVLLLVSSTRESRE